MPETNNLVEINPQLWLVRTEAGYRKLSRYVAMINNTVAGRIQGFPTIYPCVVSFTQHPNPAFDLEAKIVWLNGWVNEQLEWLTRLGQHDEIVKQQLLAYRFYAE